MSIEIINPGGSGAPTSDVYVLGSADYSNLANSVVNPTAAYGVDVAPVSAGTLDDEFAGSSLNTSTRWTWANQIGATATVKNSLCSLYSPKVAGDHWHCILQAIPAAVTYEVTCKVTPFTALASDFQGAGMCITDGTANTNKLLFFGFNHTTNQGIVVNRYSDFQTFVSATLASAGWTYAVAGPMYLRIKDNSGGNLDFSFSSDGISWYNLFSYARTTFLTPAYIGLAIESCNASVDMWMSCDWFRRTV